MGANQGTEGVSGPGAATNKGPGNNRNQFVSLLDPHIVLHGTLQLDGSGDGIYMFPSTLTSLPPERLSVIIAGKANTVEKIIEDGTGNMIGFITVGANNAIVDFMVVDAVSNTFSSQLY